MNAKSSWPYLMVAVLLALTLSARAETWTDSDWTGGNWDTIDLLDADTSPGELVLLADSLHFVPAFDATDFAGVWDLVVWQDRLYLAAGPNPPLTADGGDIIVYDYQTNSCTIDYSVFEQGCVVLKVHDGVIYSPGIDSRGSHDWGNIYFNDGSGWVRKETIPLAVHVFDMFFRDDKIWVTTGQDQSDPRGILYSSADMGDTWVEEYDVEPVNPVFEFRRLYGATTFGDTIILQPDFKEPEGMVMIELWPDGRPLVHDVLAYVGGFSGFQEYRGNLYCRLNYSLNSFDGSDWTHHNNPATAPNFVSRGITVFKDRLYVSGRQNICASEDAEDWDYAEIEDATDRVFETLETFHGRLYAGSTPHGEVHVSGVPEQGDLVSRPHCFATPADGGSVTWQALLQGPATSIKFQLRSAADEAGLDMAPFLGPDGTITSWYETSGTSMAPVHHGDSCFQYRVRLESTDARFAPVLQEFQLEIIGPTAVPAYLPTMVDLTVQPNPFNPRTSLHYELTAPATIELALFDVQGRRLTVLQGGVVPAGPHTVGWDGRDEQGREMPGGIYFARLVAGTTVTTQRLVLVR